MGLINLPLQSVLFVMKFYGASQLSSLRGVQGWQRRVVGRGGQGDDIRRISMGKHRQRKYESMQQTCGRLTGRTRVSKWHRSDGSVVLTLPVLCVSVHVDSARRGACAITLRRRAQTAREAAQRALFPGKRSALISSASLKSFGFAIY